MKDLTDPTNRDSVPAMLTPGEFVLNKEAAQMYAPLIEQMNTHGLQQRHMENKNMGGMIPQYNTGGLVDFLKEHEGYRDKAYQDQAGVWTIGYGRTRNPDGSAIKPDQTTNQKEEDAWLGKRAKTDRSATKAYGKKHGYDWNDNQIDALSSFRYNIGNLDQLTDGGTRGTEEIVQMLPEYNKAGGKTSKGLKNRRQAELDLFHGGDQQVPEMRQAPPPPQRQPLQFAAAAQPQSFGDAFAQARSAQGAGGVFNYGGQQYTTDRADDEFNRGGSVPMLNEGGWMNRFENWMNEGKPNSRQVAHDTFGYIEDPATDSDFQTIKSSQRGRDLIQKRKFDLHDVNAFYDLSKEDQKRVKQARTKLGYNNGGSIPHLNIGGWLSGLFSPDDERQRELAATADRFGNLDAAASQGAAMGTNPVIPRPQAELPIPNSDESLLQGSSQSVDQAQGEQVPQFTGEFDANNQPIMADVPYDEIPFDPAYDRPIEPYNPGADINTALDNAGQASYEEPETYTTPEGEYGGVAPAPMAIPEEPYEYASRQGTPEVVEERAAEIAAGNEDTGRINDEPMNFAAAAEDRDISGRINDEPMNFAAAAKKPTPAEKKEVATAAITQINEAATPEEVAQAEEIAQTAGGADGIETAGNVAAKAPGAVEGAKNDVQSAFGDLFDGKELARAAIMYLGARATGMSGGQALAFAGRGYMGRIDAKESTYQKVAQSGKHTPESVKAWKESGDPTDLVPLGVAPIATGNFSTKYTKSGKPVVVQEMKVGKNTILVDESGKQVNGFALENESPKDRTARRKNSTSAIKDQLKEMRKTFDTFKTKDGEGSKTDILPSTSAGKIADWAIENGVEPEDVTGLVESAYHDALNDKTTEGVRKRDLVPYLNQLVIRKQVGSNADAFKTASGGYVNANKMSILNKAAANWTESKGGQGKVSDLTNLFYNAALEDWGQLDKETKNLWNKKALKDENGFYKFSQSWLSTN